MDKKRHNLYRVLLLISLVPLVTCVIVISVFLYFMSADKAILIPTIAIAAILMFVSFAVVILLSRKICMPIAIVADNIESIGSGDLFDKAMPNSKIVETNQLIESSAKLQNELSRVLGDTKNISVNLLGMIADVTKLINDTSSNTTQISAAMKDLASGTMALAGNVQNLNLQVEYLGDCITDIDNRMDVLADSSDTMKVSNNDALDCMDQVLVSNEKSVESIDLISRQIAETNDTIAKIDEAVGLITSVAKKTNLLSLNAAIEAARAGETGRGFAVVAGEIQKLAEESGKGANRIKEIVKNIKNNADASVQLSEEVKQLISEEKGIVIETKSKFDILNKEVATSFEHISAIKEKTKTLVGIKTEIIGNVNDLSAISEENTATNEEVSASLSNIAKSVQTIAKNSDEMSKGANELQESISYFH